MASKAELIAGLRAEIEAVTREGAGAPERSRAGRAQASRAKAPARDGGRAGAGDARRRGEHAGTGGSQGGSDSAAEPELTAERAFQKILRLAATREQSTVRLRGRLARDGYAEEVAEEAIARAVRVHAVDDRRYAEALVRMRVAAGKGVEGVLAEIEELGLDPDELEALGEYRAAGEEVDVERALALLDRRPPRAKNKREAAYRKLIQQGFGSSTAATAARRWAESVR